MTPASRGHGDRLPRKFDAAVTALLAEPTIAAAAKRVGIGAQTLRKWLTFPEFAAAVQAARRRCFDHALARLQHATLDAVAALEAVIADQSADVGQRVRAADLLLTHSLRAVEIGDLAERLAALEAAAIPEKGQP